MVFAPSHRDQVYQTYLNSQKAHGFLTLSPSSSEQLTSNQHAPQPPKTQPGAKTEKLKLKKSPTENVKNYKTRSGVCQDDREREGKVIREEKSVKDSIKYRVRWADQDNAENRYKDEAYEKSTGRTQGQRCNSSYGTSCNNNSQYDTDARFARHEKFMENSEIQNLEPVIPNFNKKVERKDSKTMITGNAQELQQKDREIRRLKDENLRTNFENQILKGETKRKEKMIEELQATEMRRVQEIQPLKTENQMINSENQILEGKVKRQEKRMIEELQRRKKTSQATDMRRVQEIQLLKNENEMMNSENESLKGEIKRQEKMIKELRKERSKNIGEFELAREELVILAAKNHSLGEIVEGDRQKIEKLEKELKEKDGKLKSMEEQTQEIKLKDEKIEKLQRDLKDPTKKYQNSSVPIHNEENFRGFISWVLLIVGVIAWAYVLLK